MDDVRSEVRAAARRCVELYRERPDLEGYRPAARALERYAETGSPVDLETYARNALPRPPTESTAAYWDAWRALRRALGLSTGPDFTWRPAG